MANLVGYQPLGVQNLNRKPTSHEEENASSSGKFKYTQLWNGIVQHLQENVELKRRKHKMRSYDNCFLGTDAVDILSRYLEQHGGLERKVTHENVVKLCQVLMESNVFEAVSCSSNSAKKHTFEETSSIYYRFLGEIPAKQAKTTPCWCDDQREKHDRIHCAASSYKSLNTPSKKRKRGTSFNLGKQKPNPSEYNSAFTPMERNSKRRNSFGAGKFKVPADPREFSNSTFERGKKTRSTFAVGRFKAEIRFGESSPPETVFERKSLRRSSFGFKRKWDKQSILKADTGRVIENPCTMPKVDILQDILGQPKGVNGNIKRRKLGQEELNNIWKEATIQRLLYLMDIHHLEDILECAEEFVHDQTGGSSSSRLYMSALRRNTRAAKPESDPWLAAAHDCLEAHPEGQLIIGNYHGNTPASTVLKQARKQLLYTTIAKLFTDREIPLIPDSLTEIMTGIVALLARGKTMHAIELTQVSIMLLSSDNRRQLKGLLSFIAEASNEDAVKLSFEAFNRMTVIHTFTTPIISCPTLSEIQAKNIVAFMMDCQQKVFKVPEAVKVAALARIHRIEHGKVDLCKVYCEKISSREFELQKTEGTMQALRDTTNRIVDDAKIPLKEKKQYLQRFQKHYGDLYKKYFSDLL